MTSAQIWKDILFDTSTSQVPRRANLVGSVVTKHFVTIAIRGWPQWHLPRISPSNSIIWKFGVLSRSVCNRTAQMDLARVIRLDAGLVSGNSSISTL